jgi:hypothetical protein
MVNVRMALRIRSPVGQRAYELLRRAAALQLLFEISEASTKKSGVIVDM